MVRDNNGVVMRVCAGPLGLCDALKDEIFGLLMGLRDLHNLDVSEIIVEGDSEVVIGWAKGSFPCG